MTGSSPFLTARSARSPRLKSGESYEAEFGRLRVEELTAEWAADVLSTYWRAPSRRLKRLFDITVGCAGLLLSSVITPLIAALIRTTPGPIIVRQVRVGEGGVPFTMYKFRSMVAGAEEPGHPQWASSIDPRVTRVGAILRTTRLDELPQFWNVLKGDMSVVGPRPERPEFVDLLTRELPSWSFRHLIKPGVTGWAQIQGGYAASPIQATEKLGFDLWYLRHQSLLLDTVIVMKTVPKVLSRRGAH